MSQGTPTPTESRDFAGELAQRVAALSDSHAYAAYRTAREKVLRMKALEAERLHGTEAPSEYWTEELLNFEYMLDASPLVIERLRHHCFHITGIRVYEYRSNRDKAKRMLEGKLRALQRVGAPELLIPESRELGGFGFEIDGELYNVDTLKFYESLIALDRGGVLGDLRGGERRVVWEIGAGWGGFAYQLKTVCPKVTYVICDFAELFLFSATYLMSMFPQARACFYGDEDWRSAMAEADFVFIPHTALDELRPDRLDLTVNTVSFQEMTGEQVEAYVRHAHRLGCDYLYSLNRDRSPYNTEITSVSELLGRWYWPHEVAVLPIPYTQMLDPDDVDHVTTTARVTAKADGDYRHIVGWRRRASAPAA